jgi:hypothetical protein
MAKPNFKLSKRMVSARFWTNPELSRLAKQSKIPNLKLTMIGLWAFSDEAGIFEWQPDIAAGMIYGLDTDAERETVEPAMNAMVEAGFLKKIEVNGHRYGAWPHWGEHNDFRNNSSRYPEVADALGYPRKGGSTLNSPQRPSEVEGEVEGEVLPPTQTDKGLRRVNRRKIKPLRLPAVMVDPQSVWLVCCSVSWISRVIRSRTLACGRHKSLPS